MKKTIYLESIDYMMLQELAKKTHLKPEQYLSNLIQETYGKQKR